METIQNKAVFMRVKRHNCQFFGLVFFFIMGKGEFGWLATVIRFLSLEGDPSNSFDQAYLHHYICDFFLFVN